MSFHNGAIRPLPLRYPGARASSPQCACNCGAKGGQDDRAPGYFMVSGWPSSDGPERLLCGKTEQDSGFGNRLGLMI